MAGKKPEEGTELDVPSTHQRYLESLLDNEQEAPVFGGKTVNPDEGLNAVTEEGYVGVDPIYQNYANETEKPLAAESGPDKLAEDAYDEAFAGEPKEAGEQLQKVYGDATANSPKEETEAEAPAAEDEQPSE